MPDPAIEAHKAGLDYTEPTGKGVRKAKVSYEWVRDPNNPSAPPRQRRIVEAAPKVGMFGKLFGSGGGGQQGNGGGGGEQQYAPVPMRATVIDPGMQQAGFEGGPPTYDWLGRPKYPKPQPRYLPQLDGGQHQNAWSQPPVLLQPTPLPPNIDSMPWSERRYWYKMRDEQEKGMKLLQKAAQDAQKAREKDVKLMQKAMEKQRLREIKQHEKQLKYLRKHPHRQLPIPGYNYPIAPISAPAQTPYSPDPLSFMLSTGEEFGVRRPFDAPGMPRQLGGPPGHAGWPMMSRTMTHAVRDLSREERVHALQAGRAWDQTW